MRLDAEIPGVLRRAYRCHCEVASAGCDEAVSCAAMLKSVVDREIDFFWRIRMLGVMEMVGWREIRLVMCLILSPEVV